MQKSPTRFRVDQIYITGDSWYLTCHASYGVDGVKTGLHSVLQRESR